ncbi:MAG: hypothetical protein RBR53_00895 [Desulforegulaceae bacterium]|nr:hypothetical protein [Desulforegulaceae bacterium]
MKRLVKKLFNSRQVVFDKGRFDNWCVYVEEASGFKKAPFDSMYFSDLQKLSKFYPDKKVYNDFVRIYNDTSEKIDKNVLNLIDEIVSTYDKKHQIIVEQWFTVIYAGMIAEENKKRAILKKRVKRLGIYQVLI